MHEDPITKAKRTTDTTGAVHTITELDPWGGETNRSYWSGLQPHKYTTYERDANGGDEAMHRRYNRWSRFEQPDPYDGSYELTNLQSFNRYSYTENDPVNFVDPTGLMCFDVTRTDIIMETGQVLWQGIVRTVCDRGGFYSGGGGRGSNDTGDKKKKAKPDPQKQIEAALNACLGKIGLFIVSFEPSAKGKNGSITVNWIGGHLEGAQSFTIHNDATSFTGKELGA